MKKISFSASRTFRILFICGLLLCSVCHTVSVSAKSLSNALSDILSEPDHAKVSEISQQFRDLLESLPQSEQTETEKNPTAAPKTTAAPDSTTPTPVATVAPKSTKAPTPAITQTPVPVEIPGELQEFADNYPETADFVAEYPEKHQLHPEIDLSEEAKSEDVPLLIQWDERWGYEAFGSSFIGCSGCGPTCFSMVTVYLTHNPEYSPLYMANYVDEHGYHVKGVGTSWNFFTQGCETFGIHCTSLSVNETKIKEYLDEGFPIICSVGPGDFTVKGHLIVITGYDKKGLKINDPNSRINSEKSWDFSSIKSQIRSVWAFSAA